jgi:hypothetical protein
MGDEDNSKPEVNYAKSAREILERNRMSIMMGMAVHFAGYHPEPVNVPMFVRNNNDITLIL